MNNTTFLRSNPGFESYIQESSLEFILESCFSPIRILFITNEISDVLPESLVDDVPSYLQGKIAALDDKIYYKLLIKIEKVMHLKKSNKPVSLLLDKILKDADVFNVDKHFKLINLLIETIKELGNPGTPSFRTDSFSTLIRELMVDFLYKIKDKHPFSNKEMEDSMDVFDTTMDFLIPFGLKPSVSLLNEYEQSMVTRTIQLPTREYINQLFYESEQISSDDYERMKERYESRTPFIYYFNPNIEIEERVYDGCVLKIGYFIKATKYRQIGAGMWISKDGVMSQGYYKDKCLHNYGRFIYSNGDIYEGCWKQLRKHGQGKYEYGEDGRVEKGEWVEDKKNGEFDCELRDETIVKKIYNEDVEVE